MAMEMTTEGNLLKVSVEGRLVAAIVPGMRDDILGHVKDGMNVLFDLSKMVDRLQISVILCVPGGSDGKKSACNVGDLGSIPGLGRSPGEGMATHSSTLAWIIPMDTGAWWAAVHGVTKSQTQPSY